MLRVSKIILREIFLRWLFFLNVDFFNDFSTLHFQRWKCFDDYFSRSNVFQRLLFRQCFFQRWIFENYFFETDDWTWFNAFWKHVWTCFHPFWKDFDEGCTISYPATHPNVARWPGNVARSIPGHLPKPTRQQPRNRATWPGNAQKPGSKTGQPLPVARSLHSQL